MSIGTRSWIFAQSTTSPCPLEMACGLAALQVREVLTCTPAQATFVKFKVLIPCIKLADPQDHL